MDLLENVKFSSAPGVGPRARMVNFEMSLASGLRQGFRTTDCGRSNADGAEPGEPVVSFLSGFSTASEFDVKIRIQTDSE